MCELHLYAQSQWHSPAYIAGDREALMRLRHSITSAFCDVDYQLHIKNYRSNPGYTFPRSLRVK